MGRGRAGGRAQQPGLHSALTPPAVPRVYRLHERLVAIRTEYNLRLKAGVAVPVTQVTQVTVQSTQRRPELEDASLRYLQGLLAWVEENQRRVDGAEWGGDLPSVEAQLGSHRGLHQSIEEFRAKIERARADEVCGRPGAGPGRGQPWLRRAYACAPHRDSSPQPPGAPTGTAWAGWTCSTPSCW